MPHLMYQETSWQVYIENQVGYHSPDSVWPYLIGYIALSMSVVIIGTVRYAWAYGASIRASSVMFKNVLSRVLRALLRWLDTVPVGRILNRFTADFSVLDSRPVSDIAEFLFTLLEFLAREVKRLESIARSPILDLFDSVRAGIATIVAYDQAERYIHSTHAHVAFQPMDEILDEATSAVDKAIDALIQNSIHREFADSTLLVIAHRLATVADFDRILVMGEGRVVEYGAPRELKEARGAFWEMICESGDRDALEERIMLEE
ncbi:MAG: hypothetical protein Q9204_003414 [Flavoplaca sp. TL-2023a]